MSNTPQITFRIDEQLKDESEVNNMAENDKEEVLIPEVCLTKEELAKESERLCRWGAARAGVMLYWWL